MKTPPCEKCGSKNTYRDNDGIGPVVACLMCGKRSGAQIFVTKVREEEEPMKKPCVNCERVMWIVRDELCSLCARASEGKEGAEKDAALAKAKERIASGKLRKSEGRAPAGNIPGTVELTASPEDRVIPVTLRLTIEIGIRVTGITQAEAA